MSVEKCCGSLSSSNVDSVRRTGGHDQLELARQKRGEESLMPARVGHSSVAAGWRKRRFAAWRVKSLRVLVS